MRGREMALPESLRELRGKWINAGRIAVPRVDPLPRFECHDAHFDRLSAYGGVHWQTLTPFGLSLSKPERAASALGGI